VPIEAVFAPLGHLGLRLAARLLGTNRRRPTLVTEEEIMTMVDAGQEGGVIEQEEKAMIYSIIQLGDTLAREIMVPRIDILAFDEHTSLDEASRMLLETGHSRAPVFSGTIDQVIGLIYAKDLLEAWVAGQQHRQIKELLREAYFVPEAKKVDDLLQEMQSRQVHMSIVVDEYGGTAGLVTIEDIVEEIVGEIRDEYDLMEELPYQKLEEDAYLFNGGIDLDDVNNLLGTQLPKNTSETLGGFIYSRLGRVPTAGEVVEDSGLRLEVEQVTGRRIRKIRAEVIRSPMVESENEDHGSQRTPAE
jgi:putative hemolysin